MRHARRFAATLAAAAAFLAVANGCGDSKPPVESSMTEGNVKGKVTIKGKAPSKGTVVFDPANHLRKDVAARTAEIKPDGTYTITTLIGDNMVRVNGPEAEAAGAAYMTYNINVQAGENTLDITLPKTQ